jgi:hypothetical protein
MYFEPWIARIFVDAPQLANHSYLSIFSWQRTYPTKAKLAKASDAKLRVLASSAKEDPGPPGCRTVIGFSLFYWERSQT